MDKRGRVMDTSHIVKREDKITTARQSCMMQLGCVYGNGIMEQEKHKRKYLRKDEEYRLHKRRSLLSLGIRFIFGVLFFLFVFLIRENQISYHEFDYAYIREHILDNRMMEKAEECVQLYWKDIQQ